ncbi:MAG: hypothetical protein ACREC6_00085, partial [Hyphomicrobiaceae bacterium]
MGGFIVLYRRLMAVVAAVAKAFEVVCAFIAWIGYLLFLPRKRTSAVSWSILLAHVLFNAALIYFLVENKNVGLTSLVSIGFVLLYFCMIAAAFFGLSEDNEIWDGSLAEDDSRFHKRLSYVKSKGVVAAAALITILWVAAFGMSFDAWTQGRLLASRPNFGCVAEICKYAEFLTVVGSESPGLDWIVERIGLAQQIRFALDLGTLYKALIYLSCWWLAFKVYSAIKSQRQAVRTLLTALEKQKVSEVIDYIIARIKFAPIYIRRAIVNWSVRHRENVTRLKCIEAARQAKIVEFPQTFIKYLHAGQTDTIKTRGLDA